MNARLMATCTICFLALAAFALAPQISAQTRSGDASSRGIFSSLKVGQMVAYSNDAWGSPMITTYEDEESKPLMRHKVREIGHDYLALEFDDREGTGSLVESRISAHRLSLLAHVGKTRKSGATGTSDDSLLDKPKPAGKTTTTKKKN